MNLVDFLFLVFATLAVGGGVLMIFSRHPVSAAMFMIVSMVSVAGLFVLLESFFLAILQVLVYAGAVMVLFLTIVINDSGDSSLQLMTWPERERNRWRRFLSIKNHPVDIVAFAELRWLLDIPEPVMPTKEEMERKYKRQARYERKKEKRCL